MPGFLETLSSYSDAIIGNAPPEKAPAPAPVPVPTVSAPISMPVAPAATAAKLTKDIGMLDVALSDPNVMAMVNESRNRDNSLTKDNLVLEDRKNLSSAAFIQKYGSETFDKVAALDVGKSHLSDLSNRQIAPLDQVGNTGWDVVGGLAQGIGSLSDFVVSPLQHETGVAIAEGMGVIKKFTDSLKSSTEQDRSYVDALRTELDAQDNRKAKGEEPAPVSVEDKFVSSLREIGRGITAGAGRLIEDPQMLKIGVGEAGGSMLVGGPASKLLAGGAEALGAKVLTNTTGAAGGAGAAAASKAIEAAAFPVTIGALESGGAYAQTAQEVMAIPHETLAKNSTAYVALRNQGMSERDAKVELAARAGNVASALTFPVAALSGKLVEGLEKNLAGSVLNGPREAITNMAKEGVEEFTQSGFGQFAGNVGQAVTVDPNKSLAEGVGEQAIQGAIMGAGSAGVLQAPGSAAAGVAAVGKVAYDAAANQLQGVADKVRAANEASSPVSPQSLAPEIQEAAQAAPTVAEAVRSVISEVPAEQQPVLETVAQNIETAFTISPEELSTLHPEIQAGLAEIAPDGANRFDAMMMAALAANNPAMSQEARTDAGLWLMSQKQKTDEFIASGKDVMGELDHSRPEVASYDRFTQVLSAISESPSMQEAMRWVAEDMAAPVVSSDVDFSSPEGLQVIKTTADIARLVPEKIDLASADVILKQDREKQILTPVQRQDIHAAAALATATQALKQGVPNENIDATNHQIVTAGGKSGHQQSLKQHAFNITLALRLGETNTAKRRLQHLGMFARSQRNKLDAMNQAIVNGDRLKVPYQALGPDNKWLPKDGKQAVYFNPGTAASMQLAQQIHAETTALAALQNSFADEYPEFGVQKIAVPALVSAPDNISKSIEVNPDTKTERGSSKATETKAKSQATTSEVEPISITPELPLPPSQAVPPKAAPQEAPAAPTPVVKPAVVAEAAEEVVNTKPKEPAQEPVAKAGKVETEKTDEAFPNLVRSQGKNQFHRVFRSPKVQKSRMFENESPMRALDEQLDNENEIKKLTGMSPDQTQIAAFKDLLQLVDKAYDAMDARLASKPDLLELLKKDEPGQPANPFIRGRVLNIVEPKGDSFGYNAQLRESALIAGLDWLVNGQVTEGNLDREDLQTSLGLKDITSEMVDFFNDGLSVDYAKQQLAKRIVDFWGMDVDKSVDMAFAQGIPQAVAIEVLSAFSEVGLIQHVLDKRFMPTTGKEYGRILFDNRSEKTADLFKNIGSARSLIGELALIDNDVSTVSVGEPIRKVAKTQLRNGAVKTTRQNRLALEHEQQVKYLPNMPMFEFMEAIGEDNFVQLMGGTQSIERLNVNHARSVDGKNRGLRMAFQNVQTQMGEVRDHAERNGLPIGEVPSFYPHEITRVGRMQMMGRANPQSDKLAREIFMPTRSVLDLTNENHVDLFWLTAAQGLGVKTEKDPRAVSRAKAEAMAAGEYAGVISDLKTWLGTKTELPKDLVARIRTVNPKITMHGVHSLISIAQMQRAVETGDNLNQFTHFNYLEADGKSNGPINALMLFARGAFTRDWVRAVGKGGVFFGPSVKGKTLNAHQIEDAVDLYGEATNEHQVELKSLMEHLGTVSPALVEQMRAMLNLFDALNADVSFDEAKSEIKIGRGVGKNPLTISIYGSGDDGIAGKVTGELVDLIYAKMSSFIEAKTANADTTFEQTTYEGFFSDLSALASDRAVRDRKTGVYSMKEGFKAKKPISAGDLAASRTPEGYTLFPHEYQNLKQNVRTLFVDPLAVAIRNTVIGHVGSTTQVIQQATQTQSIVMRALFRRAIIEKLLDKKLNDPDYRDGEFLSESELQEIITKLMPMGASFSSGGQSYFIGGSEQGDILGNTDAKGKQKPIVLTVGKEKISIRVPEYFARGLDDDFSSAPLIYAPSLAGVKALASITIGSGDGQMMLNAATNSKIEQVLKVFDGMNMPADKIEEYSTAINQSVHQTWTDNPVRAVAKSFRDFLNNEPFALTLNSSDAINQQTQLMQDVLLEMTKVLTGDPDPQAKDIVDIGDIHTFVQTLAENLEQTADELDARAEVLKQFPMTVDQMASGESPYVHEGTVEVLASEDVVDRMNALFTAALAKIQGHAAVEAVAPADAVRVVDAEALPAELSAIGSLNASQTDLMATALKALAKTGYRAVFGTATQVDAWLQQNNAERYQPNQLDDANGFVDPVAKLLVVVNGSPETTLHEMIHAATFQKVASFYANPESVSEVEALAVENIEGLMNEWLGEDYSTEDELTQTAQRMAANAIRQHNLAGRKAAAVNEFMAWVLSNQHLADKAAKTQVKLFKIVGETLKAIRDLVWGRKNVKAPTAGTDILSQLRFNTHILMAMPTTSELLIKDSADTALYQSASFGQSDRLSELRQRFHEKITSWVSNEVVEHFTTAAAANNPMASRANLETAVRQMIQDGDPLVTEKQKDLVQQPYIDAAAVAEGFKNGGFLGTMQEISTFNEIVAAMAVDVQLNPNSLSRIQDLYDHVIDKLVVKDLLTGVGDPGADEYAAQQKFDALHGLYAQTTDAKGRSSLMPSFMALGMVDENFRSVLAKMAPPKIEKNNNPRTVDSTLEDLALAGMDRVSRSVSGEGRDQISVQAALDHLVKALIENTGDTRSYIEMQTEKGIEGVDRYLANQIENLSDNLGRKADAIINGNANPALKAGAYLVRAVTTLVNQDQAEDAALGVVHWLNTKENAHARRELANDAVGRNKDNAKVFDMITRVRSAVQQTRQQFREHLPTVLAGKFKTQKGQTRKLSPAEWTAMYRGLAKTDLAALHSAHGVAGSLELVTDGQKLTAEITKLEGQLVALDARRFVTIQEKSKQLANYMLTGEHGPGLLRNAYAVANLAGRRGYSLSAVDEALVEQIDRLVTLYAIQGMEQSSKDAVANLVSFHKDAVGFTLSSLRGLRKGETDKGQSPVARFNSYKGHVPSQGQQGASLIVADASEHARLLMLGYTRVASYVGSSADRNLGRKAYYFTPVSGRAAYNQGVLQTVQRTVNGIDPETGFTVGELTAGRITDPAIVALVNRQLVNQRQTAENLLPVYDAQGNVVAFERSVDPRELVRLNQSTDLSKAMGVWAGRQAEEELAGDFNTALIGNLHDIWTAGKSARQGNQFVDLSRLKKTDDAVLHEAWRLIPQHTKEQIKETFGNEGFRVRRDMLNDAVGYRSASIGDMFTGDTRWKPSVHKAFQDFAIGLFGQIGHGNKAFSSLVKVENITQDLVANAKVLIVVKSVIVPAANVVSNGFQLLNRGVPLRHILKGFASKTIEVNDFIKRRHQEIELEAELRAATGINDLTAIRKLESRIQTLKDSYKRMSIYPLIEAGEFSAISNGVVTEEDLVLSEGRWGDWAEKLARRIPGSARTAWRYGFMTRDTALFQGLAKATQYGDFLGKAVLYDDLVKRRKMGSEEAIAQVNEAFVNYNRLSGRSRQYLESVGVLWFYNFKLRSIKEAGYMLRHHPLRSLMMAVMPPLPLVGEVGSAVSDNFLTLFFQGSLPWSIGPSMGFNAFSLNPVVNVFK